PASVITARYGPRSFILHPPQELRPMPAPVRSADLPPKCQTDLFTQLQLLNVLNRTIWLQFLLELVLWLRDFHLENTGGRSCRYSTMQSIVGAIPGIPTRA